MNSQFESLSNELFYELFDYIPSGEILYSFINLNYRLNKTIDSYPLNIDFRGISRTKFDFVCHHLRPKQVISLIFSEENIPNQVELFHKKFPYVQNEFIHLRKVIFIKTQTVLLNLPFSVSHLSFQSCADSLIQTILIRQAEFLTHVKVKNAEIFQSMNITFPELTHLTINDDVVSDLEISFSRSLLPLIDLPSMIRNLYSSITHLHLFIMKNNLKSEDSIQNFEYLSYCLTHFTLVFSRDMNISFEFLKNCLIKLNQITHLTIQASGKRDLIDGQRWEEFISKTRIIKFVFKFIFNTIDSNIQDEIDLLESFRSSFWVEDKHWYVALHREDQWPNRIIIYSIPRFRPRFIKYPTYNYPPLSTAPLYLNQQFFYSSEIRHLSCYLNDPMIFGNFRFTQVSELCLVGSTLASIDSILSIVNLNQITKLDVTHIENISIDKLNDLLNHTTRLYLLKLTNFDVLLNIPSHIRCIVLKNTIQLIDLDTFCHVLSYIEKVKLPVESEEMIIQLVNRIECLHNIVLCFSPWCSLSNMTIKWFQQNSHRFNTQNFTCQFSNTLFPDIYLSSIIDV